MHIVPHRSDEDGVVNTNKFSVNQGWHCQEAFDAFRSWQRSGQRRGTWKPSGLPGNLNVSLALCVISDPPEQVIMELQKSSTGQSWHYNLKCHIVRVAPLSKLTVTFFKGAERLHSQKLWNYTRPERANVTVTHPITLGPWDHGKAATCHVMLDFSPHKKPFTAASRKVALRTAGEFVGITCSESPF